MYIEPQEQMQEESYICISTSCIRRLEPMHTRAQTGKGLRDFQVCITHNQS